jgi:hypothetical protein
MVGTNIKIAEELWTARCLEARNYRQRNAMEHIEPLKKNLE